MTVPTWFTKDLELIDPTYFVFPNEEYQYFEIRKRMDIDRKDKINKKSVHIKDPTVAVFKSLNDDALISLRRRKYIGLKYKQDTLGYLRDIKRQNKEAQQKAIEIAREQMTEGFMRIFSTKQYYT